MSSSKEARDLKERPFSKQVEYAAAIRARLVAIVGPREIKENKVRLRDMKTGQERDVQKNQVAQQARKIVAFESWRP